MSAEPARRRHRGFKRRRAVTAGMTRRAAAMHFFVLRFKFVTATKYASVYRILTLNI